MDHNFIVRNNGTEPAHTDLVQHQPTLKAIGWQQCLNSSDFARSLPISSADAALVVRQKLVSRLRAGRRIRVKTFALLSLFIISVGISGCAAPPAKASKIPPAKVEPIAGTSSKRVVLTESAAQRIGIQTAAVREGPVVHKRKYGAEIWASPIPPQQGAVLRPTPTRAPGLPALPTPAFSSQVLVRVSLNESDLKKVRRVEPGLVLLLDGAAGGTGWSARLVNTPPGQDPEEISWALFYEVNGVDPQLALGRRVFIELVLAGSGSVRKIIPFSAVLLDTQGNAWTYTNPEPLVFVRQPIDIDYVEADQAILWEGPTAGTPVLTVGAAELYGAEVGVGK